MIISEAKKYLGADLETKYRIIDYYNANCTKYVKVSRKYRVQYSDNWCATFTSVIAHKCGLLGSDFPFECGVEEQVRIAKLRGVFYTDLDMVKPNDLIIYDWNNDQWADHVGFVVERSDGTIKVIEGNIRNTVGYRTIPQKSKSIRGFIRIGVSPKKLSVDDERNRIGDLAKRVINGDFGNGVERQRGLGDDYKAVQNYINVYYT